MKTPNPIPGSQDVVVFARAIAWVGLTNKQGWRWRGVSYDMEHGYRECGEHFHATKKQAKDCASAASQQESPVQQEAEQAWRSLSAEERAEIRRRADADRITTWPAPVLWLLATIESRDAEFKALMPYIQHKDCELSLRGYCSCGLNSLLEKGTSPVTQQEEKSK